MTRTAKAVMPVTARATPTLARITAARFIWITSFRDGRAEREAIRGVRALAQRLGTEPGRGPGRREDQAQQPHQGAAACRMRVRLAGGCRRQWRGGERRLGVRVASEPLADRT